MKMTGSIETDFIEVSIYDSAIDIQVSPQVFLGLSSKQNALQFLLDLCGQIEYVMEELESEDD